MIFRIVVFILAGSLSVVAISLLVLSVFSVKDCKSRSKTSDVCFGAWTFWVSAFFQFCFSVAGSGFQMFFCCTFPAEELPFLAIIFLPTLSFFALGVFFIYPTMKWMKADGSGIEIHKPFCRTAYFRYGEITAVKLRTCMTRSVAFSRWRCVCDAVRIYAGGKRIFSADEEYRGMENCLELLRKKVDFRRFDDKHKGNGKIRKK